MKQPLAHTALFLALSVSTSSLSTSYIASTSLPSKQSLKAELLKSTSYDDFLLEAQSQSRLKLVPTAAATRYALGACTLIAALAVGLLSAHAVISSKLAVNKLLSVSAKTLWSPLIGALSVSLIYSVKKDLAVGPVSIVGAESFSPVRQLARLAASVVTLGSGCALGMAGPAAEFAGVIGRLIGVLLESILSEMLIRISLVTRGTTNNSSKNMLTRESSQGGVVHTLFMAGVAAGIAANFDAPFAGLLFALEVGRQWLPPNVELSTPSSEQQGTRNKVSWQRRVLLVLKVVPAIALATTSSVYVCRRGDFSRVARHMLSTIRYFGPAPTLLQVLSLPQVALHCFGVIAVGLATAIAVSWVNSLRVLFTQRLLVGDIKPKAATVGAGDARAASGRSLLLWVIDCFRWRPLLGGFACSLLAASSLSQALPHGFATMVAIADTQGAYSSPSPLSPALLSTLAARMLSFPLCQASGLIGGAVAPLLFIGSVVGAIVSNVVRYMSITLGIGAGGAGVSWRAVYSLSGAAAALSAGLRCPCTASALVVELTQQPLLLAPSLIAALVSAVFSHHLRALHHSGGGRITSNEPGLVKND